MHYKMQLKTKKKLWYVTCFYVQMPDNLKFLQLIFYDQEIFYYDTKLHHTLYIKLSYTYNFLVSYQVT